MTWIRKWKVQKAPNSTSAIGYFIIRSGSNYVLVVLKKC